MRITEPRLWYLAMLVGLLAGIALAVNVKPLTQSHGKMFYGCAPTYCVS